MPPPPSGEMGQSGGDSGKTKDQLTADAKAVSSTDSGLSNLLTSVANNFDKADTNHDGKVDAKETMAYAIKQKDSATSSDSTISSTSSSSSTTTSSTSSTNDKLLAQIMELMRAYGMGDNSTASNSLFSAQA
jgi:hypothetical protein